MNLFRTPTKTLEFFRENFQELYRKTKKGGDLDENEERLYNKIIYVANLDDLYEWVSQVQSKMEWEKNVKKEESEQTSRWKFWKYSRSASLVSYEVFKEAEDASKDLLPKSYVWLVFRLLGC